MYFVSKTLNFIEQPISRESRYRSIYKLYDTISDPVPTEAVKKKESEFKKFTDI